MKNSNLYLILLFISLCSFTTKAKNTAAASNAEGKPNIIYILTDQWRASALGYDGDPNVKTPNIDNFANAAVNFTNAISVAPVCTPHRAALLTGRYPTSTGMFLNDTYLPEEELCMAEIFKFAGYNTAYMGKWHLDGHGRLNNVAPERRQGFDEWKALECSHNYVKMAYYDNDSPEMKYWKGYSPFAISKEAQNYIAKQARSEDPFLLVLSLATPHFPHHSAPIEYYELYPREEIELAPTVPEKLHEKVRKEIQGYYAHATATDKAIGELLDEIKKLGMMENTIIVFTSDHGEMMGSHGELPFSKQVAWDESVRVPFLISYPGIGENAGTKVYAPLTTPDILPSLLGLTNIKIPKSTEGEDLSKLMKKPDPVKNRAALFMSICPFSREHVHPEYRGIYTNQYVYVKTLEGASMFYDLKNDPYQMNNLLGKSAYEKVQKSLDKKLRKELKKIGDDFQPRAYYLDKWNLILNADGKNVDYQNFSKGKGLVQSPTLSE